MSKVDMVELHDELVYFLRNTITDPESRGSSSTETFSGNGNTKTFYLDKAGAKNVNYVVLSGGTQSYGDDYSVAMSSTGSSSIVMVVAPGTATNNLSVTYHYGETWVYPDYPRKDLAIGAFPRIGFGEVSSNTKVFGLNASSFMTTKLIGIQIVAKDPKTLYDIVNDVKDAFIDNKKGFYLFNLVVPVDISPVLPFGAGKTELVQQTITVEIPFIYET